MIIIFLQKPVRHWGHEGDISRRPFNHFRNGRVIEARDCVGVTSEKSLKFLNDAQIIFGGMGYETADSKRQRGEPAFGMEQLVRDITMYRIGEGATDILRPFVAREGLNTHLENRKNIFITWKIYWNRLM